MKPALPCLAIAIARRITQALVAAVIALGWSPAVHAGAKEGLAALELSDYRTAIRELTPAAEQGDTAAQAALGRIHLNGWGTARDPATAARWFRRAAEAGDPVSRKMLAFLYESGIGVPKDAEEAKRWLAAAESGASTRQPQAAPVRFGDYEDRYIRIGSRRILQETALMRAIERRDRAAVMKLLELGADINQRASNGNALSMAGIYFPDLIETLLARGADADMRTGSGDNELSSQLRAGATEGYPVCPDLKTIRLLIERGADVNVRNQYGATPLSYAKRLVQGCKDRQAIVQLLLERGARE